jgi:hypothetical protein
LLSPPEDRRSVVRGESGSNLHARLAGTLVAGRKDKLHCIHGERFSLCDHPEQPRRLFDRTVDPNLRVDVSSSHPAQVQALGTAWEAWPVERTRQRFVRTSAHVLVATPQLDGTYVNRLYNHQTDPTLSTDVATAYPDIMAALMKELVTWHETLDQANEAPSDRTKDQEDALRSLGYIE